MTGLIIGSIGLPVPVPGTGWWTWFQPLGFHTASIFILSSLGFLCGLIVDLLRLNRRTQIPEMFIWFTGFAVVALLISVVQIYRLAASDADENWSTVSSCLAITYSVSQGLDKNPSKADIEMMSTELMDSGAKLYVVSRYYDRDRKQNISLENVSSGLNTAGMMLLSQNPPDVQQAKRFIQNAGDLFIKIERQANGAYNQRTAQTILNLISTAEPPTLSRITGDFSAHNTSVIIHLLLPGDILPWFVQC